MIMTDYCHPIFNLLIERGYVLIASDRVFLNKEYNIILEVILKTEYLAIGASGKNEYSNIIYDYNNLNMFGDAILHVSHIKFTDDKHFYGNLDKIIFELSELAKRVSLDLEFDIERIYNINSNTLLNKSNIPFSSLKNILIKHDFVAIGYYKFLKFNNNQKNTIVDIEKDIIRDDVKENLKYFLEIILNTKSNLRANEIEVYFNEMLVININNLIQARNAISKAQLIQALGFLKKYYEMIPYYYKSTTGFYIISKLYEKLKIKE